MSTISETHHCPLNKTKGLFLSVTNMILIEMKQCTSCRSCALYTRGFASDIRFVFDNEKERRSISLFPGLARIHRLFFCIHWTFDGVPDVSPNREAALTVNFNGLKLSASLSRLHLLSTALGPFIPPHHLNYRLR